MNEKKKQIFKEIEDANAKLVDLAERIETAVQQFIYAEDCFPTKNIKEGAEFTG